MKYFLLFPLLLTSSVMAQEPDSTSALYSMREAERSFARASAMFGRNAAFVQNFADESVIFSDKWITNGKQFWEDLKAYPVVLKWEPEFMDISESRDFGISTGPWEVQEYRPNTAPVATGYFLTVWKKQSDGAWKVILDAGLTTPQITALQHNFTFPPGADKVISDPPVKNIELSCKELLDRENQFGLAWGKNPVGSTYKSFLTNEARLQLSGHLPAINSDTVNVLIAGLDSKMIWIPAGAGAATSGDLGYTYGLLKIPGTPELIKGHYVRIWKKHSGAGWRIFLEMININ